MGRLPRRRLMFCQQAAPAPLVLMQLLEHHEQQIIWAHLLQEQADRAITNLTCRVPLWSKLHTVSTRTVPDHIKTPSQHPTPRALDLYRPAAQISPREESFWCNLHFAWRCSAMYFGFQGIHSSITHTSWIQRDQFQGASYL
jgi:hypothetical protein